MNIWLFSQIERRKIDEMQIPEKVTFTLPFCDASVMKIPELRTKWYLNNNETLSKREFTSLDKFNCFNLHQQCQRLNSKSKDFSAAMAERF